MNPTIERLERLEGRFERLLFLVKRLQSQVSALQNQSQLQQSNQQPSGGVGGIVYSIAAQAITGGGSATGVTVSTHSAGALLAISGTYTVYNQMGAATSATAGRIIVGPNADSSFDCISQGCS
jgi:hypothetical protein